MSGSVTIPQTIDGKNIVSLGFEAFSGSTTITEITIPNSATKIGGFAFAGCTNLAKITILDNVKNIGINCFKDHNDNLTINCYAESVADQYAIDNNIKYLHLTKQNQTGSAQDYEEDRKTQNEEKTQNQQTTTGNTNSNNSNSNKNNTNSTKKDTTTAAGKLPQTGIKIFLVIILLVSIAVCVISKIKSNKYKDI